MQKLTAILDACVLYPAPLRDLLMNLAVTDLFLARWTEDIHEEWITNLLQNRPDLKREKLEQTRDLMNRNVRDCLVGGYRRLIPSLMLLDPADRHVLAAAVTAPATLIVTFILKDFPASTLEEPGIEAQHPDDFIERLLEASLELVCLAVQRQRQSLRKPPKTVDELLETLQQQGLEKSIAILREYSHLL